MFVESTLQQLEYLSVQMPTNSPGENISRSANHIYVNCAKYLSNLYSNCEFRFIAFRGPFPACLLYFMGCTWTGPQAEGEEEVELMLMMTGTKQQHCSFMLI